MWLGDWLKRERIRPTRFGKNLGLSHTCILRIVRRETRPGWETMLLIEAATGGEVEPNDFRGPGWPVERARMELEALREAQEAERRAEKEARRQERVAQAAE